MTATVTDLASAADRKTAAERRAELNLVELAQAMAEKQGVCRRPLPMLATTEGDGTKYIGTPCKSTLECVCPARAARARLLRIQQAHEGWHIKEEPVVEKKEPTEQQAELLKARAVMAESYQQARDDGDEEMMAGIREVVEDLDAELRETGIRGKLRAWIRNRKRSANGLLVVSSRCRTCRVRRSVRPLSDGCMRASTGRHCS
ncbi:replication initiator [Nocardia flavorosea]|uniref:replication initiator n=1 Tax=Nocardia flavorosea TaxID=53429 RepID=UPI000AD9C149|nr:replication initiator [Nocardia flavorosea]